ncbi:hypothetical protein F5Y15DRAFT_420257 [Xylariaceae sp. FL0016]|nr:hypothetical protein F5Y15DRAFT_420257 [Xylariaceae sp. FL0016]
MDGQIMRLPLELIFQVMTSLLPSNPDALVPVSHDGTQLLIVFALVSRATHQVAIRNIQRHCLYLDSDHLLGRFLLSLEASLRPPPGVSLPSVFRGLSTLYLAPFGRSIDNLPTAQWTRELFYYTCGSLRRLIVDIPFASLPPWDDHLGVGPVLQEGFVQLTQLNEFVCTRDALRFSMESDSDAGEELRPLLQSWPNLRRLGLNRPQCSPRFWQCVASLPKLECLVLSSPLAMTSATNDFDFMSYYGERARRPLTVVLAQNQLDILQQRAKVTPPTDSRSGNANAMRVVNYKTPVSARSGDGVTGQTWLTQTALDGELWDDRSETAS